MWHWILCYLAGQHEFTITCEREAVFLRCRSCGRRSNGWELGTPQPTAQSRVTRERQLATLPVPSLIARHR